MISQSEDVPAQEALPSMVQLLGTSHVSTASSRAVAAAVAHADVVAIELDAGRAHGLMSGQRATFSDLRAALGLRAAVVAYSLRGLQERIAKSLGVVPGLEMKAALEVAEKSGKPIALIDRDVRVTLRRLSASLGWREFRAFCGDLFRRRKVSVHPSDELVLQLLGEMRERYPRVYKAMVSERDAYMVAQIRALTQHYPGKTILVVIGKGHVPGMSALLEEAGTRFIVLDDGAHIVKPRH